VVFDALEEFFEGLVITAGSGQTEAEAAVLVLEGDFGRLRRRNGAANRL
jgi:hypothetical protein